MTTENESPPSQPDSAADTPGESADAPEQRECFYCHAPADGKSFTVWLHHKGQRQEARVNVPRCRHCVRRHEGWIFVVGCAVLLAILAGVVKKRVEFGQAGEAALSAAIVGLVALGLASVHFWPKIMLRLYGYPGEKHGYGHPFIQNFLSRGFEIGRYPRDDDGNIIEHLTDESGKT